MLPQGWRGALIPTPPEDTVQGRYRKADLREAEDIATDPRAMGLTPARVRLKLKRVELAGYLKLQRPNCL